MKPLLRTIGITETSIENNRYMNETSIANNRYINETSIENS